MAATRTETQSDSFPGGAGHLQQLLGLARREVEDYLPEGATVDRTQREAFALLLAYGCAIERILAEAAGRRGTLPGHSVSLRSYVEQLFRGEAQGLTIGRFEAYFTDAVTQIARLGLDSETALQGWAERLVDQFHPDRIEARVRPSGLLRLFGLHEGAYWREYKVKFQSLDAQGIRRLARKEGA